MERTPPPSDPVGEPTNASSHDPAHAPVLLEQTLRVLAPKPGEVYADATAGRGGHAGEVASSLGPEGRVCLVDLDRGNLDAAATRVRSGFAGPDERVIGWHASFAALPGLLERERLRADMVLADLGFASNQVDDAERGFSFRRDGPLDMRLDPSGALSAEDLVNRADRRELMRIIRDFGEDRLAPRIADAIVRERSKQPVTRTSQLAEIVRRCYPGGPRREKIDPATRTFQALRIAVNDELGQLSALLGAIASAAERLSRDPGAPTWLAPGARVAIITFHSLEDRPVKHAFRDMVAAGHATASERRPIVAEDSEIRVNPRARSAKLRSVELPMSSSSSDAASDS